MRFAVSIFVVGILGACLLCGVFAAPFLNVDSSIIFALSFVGGIFLAMTLGIGAIAVYRIRRDNSLDEAFTTIGLEGKAYQIGGRQFHGTAQGRTIEVYLQRGPMLDIHVHAPFKTEVAIGTKSSLGSAINRAIKREPMQLGNPLYEQMLIFAKDEEWTRKLLDTRKAGEALNHLMPSRTTELRQVQISADTILFRIHRVNPGHITSEAVQNWLGAIFLLIEAAENLPEPTITTEPSDFARNVRQSSFNSPAMIIGIAGVIVGVTVVGVILMTVLLLAVGG